MWSTPPPTSPPPKEPCSDCRRTHPPRRPAGGRPRHLPPRAPLGVDQVHQPALHGVDDRRHPGGDGRILGTEDRKSTRLNSSHVAISYAVFCLKQKNRR